MATRLRWLAAEVRRHGTTRFFFEVFLVVQLLHLCEHVAQMVQLHVLGWPPPTARGIVSQLDVEKVHAAWNVLVLGALAWLLVRGVRSAWLIATFAWATLHTIEHSYLLTRALMTGLESQPGILGVRGVLASAGVDVPGLTTWTRPTVHFAWNLGEVTLLALAYLAFRGMRVVVDIPVRTLLPRARSCCSSCSSRRRAPRPPSRSWRSRRSRSSSTVSASSRASPWPGMAPPTCPT
jgi:hypothetical protein